MKTQAFIKLGCVLGVLFVGLFKISATGVSTKPVREAADAFLKGLSADQRSRTLFPVDDDEWRKWDNRSFPPRQGVGFKEMTGRQREFAFGLLRASLSAKGLQTAYSSRAPDCLITGAQRAISALRNAAN